MPSDHPNVLFVVVDDLRPQLKCYGVDWILSPNIDALADQGTVFERAYCQQAICAPSRASVLSGCRPATTGIYDLQTPLRTAMPDVLTLPQHFKENGYETVSIGKVYHHSKDDLQGWSTEPFQSKGDWQGRGYLTDEAIATIAICDAEMQAQGSTRRGLGPATEAADVPDDGYHDGKDALVAVTELERLATLDRPFFLALGFHKPHLPFNAPKRYWDMYHEDEIPLAANPFEPEGITEFSLTNFGELRAYFGLPKEGPVPDELARRLIHGYAACVTYMDAQQGRVLQQLDRLGLRHNTIVMLWGDHGWKLGEHASWSKHTNFEIDARAPLLVSAPGRPGGQRSPALVEFVDLYPTLCELCWLPVPDHCEGLSFAPLLSEPDRPWKSAAFSQYPRNNGEVMGTTMRTDRYRYTEWRDTATGELLANELYDHLADPQENVNAATDPANVATVTQLAAQLAAGWRAEVTVSPSMPEATSQAEQVALLADKLRDVSALGLYFARNPYDAAHYRTVQDVAMSLMALATDTPLDEMEPLRAPVFSRPTPVAVGDAAVIDPADGHILLVRRADDECWAMPGGAFEVGETPAEGAEREALEETGIRCKARTLVGVFDSRLCGSKSRHHLYQFAFLCTPLNRDDPEASTTPQETMDVAWFAEDEIPDELSPGHADRIREALRVWHTGGPATFDA